MPLPSWPDTKLLTSRASVLARSKRAHVEGIAIIPFPTFADAKAWYESPAYQRASQHRFGGADYNIAIIEGAGPAKSRESVDHSVSPMLARATTVAILLCVGLSCRAESTLPAAERSHLENVRDFRMVSVSTPLPREILAFCADQNGLIAAPGERWNAIDVLFVGVPTRRVVWASGDDGLFVVHYEQGGFSQSFHVTIAKVNATGYELIWRADGPRLRDHPDFVRALKAGAFQPEPLEIR